MYCRECGSENTEGSLFCRNCATPLREDAAVPDRTVAMPMPEPPAPQRQTGPIWEPGEDEVAELLRRAVDAETVGDLGGAIEMAEEAVRVDSAHAGARSSLAGFYERAGRTADAIGQYEAALQLDPSSRVDRLRLARIAPGHPALAGAAGRPTDRRGLMVAAGVAAGVFLLVTGGGLAAYFGWWAPRHTPSGAGAVAAGLGSPQLESARAALAGGDLVTAERELTAILSHDPTDTAAKTLLQEVWRRQAGLAPDPSLERTGLGALVFAGSESQSASSDAVLGVEDGIQAGRTAASATPELPLLPVPAPDGGIPPVPGAVTTLPPVALPPAASTTPTGPTPRHSLAGQVTGGERQAYTDGSGAPSGFLTDLPAASASGGWGATSNVQGGGLTRGGPRGTQPAPYQPGPSAPVAASGGAPTPEAPRGTIQPGGSGTRTIQPQDNGSGGGRFSVTPRGGGGARPSSGGSGSSEDLANQAARLHIEAQKAATPEERVRGLQSSRALWEKSGSPSAGAHLNAIDRELRALGAGR